MRIKNLTSFLAGAKATSRRPPHPEMTLIVRGAYVLSPGDPLRLPDGPFPLSQGSLSAETFREDDEARIGECLYPGDFADFKLRADVLLRGVCHAPRGRPVAECPVRFSDGAWSKTLRVVGHRAWVQGAAGDAATEPLGFTSMPIGYENAFGGPTYAPNPAGKGYRTGELPNVEHAARPVRSPGDRIEPTGFGPLNPAWPQRADRLGKEYGESYRRERFPHYARDFDLSYFNAAPEDQQIEGYLRGDEEVGFSNLSARAADFSVQLPGLRVRAFVNDVRGSFREIRMSLDTLFADLPGERLYLTWRGVEPVAEDDLHDVTAVLVAAEPLAEKPRPEAEYRTALTVFEKDPIGLPDEIFGPRGLLRATPKGGAPAPDPLTALLQQKLGGTAGPEQARIAAAVERMRKVKLPPGVSLDALLAKAVNDLPARGAGPLAGTAGAPRAPIGGALRKLLSNVAALEKAAALRGRTIPDLQKLHALANDPRIAALDPSFRRAGGPPDADLGPGKDLAGADLRGRDLTGCDLRGANLDGALLSGAILRSADLSGANLTAAVLFEADLGDANLGGANLTGATLASARAEGASFERARLDEVNAGKARFARAAFAEATARDAVFEEADFSGAKLHKAAFDKAIFDGANFTGADFSGAQVLGCRCERVAGTDAVFARATLTGSTFAGAGLAGARLAEALGERSVWIGADLTRADFRWAALVRSHFSEASAAEARFRAADLRDARFYRASLPGASFVEANLLRADLCKATLTRATFTGANLYDAKLLGAKLDGADLRGANLERSTLERT